MKYYIWTIGCQYNEWDGARIKYALDQSGFVETDPNSANFIIILACAVRQTAVNRIYGKLNAWKDKKIVVSGCVLKGDKVKFEKRGAKTIDWDNAGKIAKTLCIKNVEKFEALLNQGSTESAYVPIMSGCNNFCSYCAVPYTRGRETSRDPESVIKEVEELAQTGRKEIILLGQNVNSYEFGFSSLLKKLNDIEGDFEISFTSNHPKDMTNDIIDAVATLPKVKKEIHLPLQSGSNKILKAMNRPYTIEQYLRLVKKIKAKIPNVKITTDVIVGFPGETEEDFQKTVDVFKTIEYFQAYINKYSPRAGTAAFALGDPIPWAEKQRRWHVLNKLLPKQN